MRVETRMSTLLVHCHEAKFIFLFLKELIAGYIRSAGLSDPKNFARNSFSNRSTPLGFSKDAFTTAIYVFYIKK